MSADHVAGFLIAMRTKPHLKQMCLVGFLVLCGCFSAKASAPPSVKLSLGGVAKMPIVISSQASVRTQTMANTLADYLSRMGGASFVVESGTGQIGIALGVATDFPVLGLAAQFAPADPLLRENYLLLSHAAGLQVIGATDLAVEHAAWDLLYRLGYRQFFPGVTWEVVPSPADLAIAVDTFEQPDFHTRLIWYGYGTWVYNVQPYAEWNARNRAGRTFGLQTAHMYQSLIRSQEYLFTNSHPEYLALVDGERTRVGSKLCISNPDLRALAVDFVLERLRKDPSQDCVSAEPADGGGWCECANCAALGSISDRVVILANQIARAVWSEFPGKQVGLLAYNEHCTPPSIEVEPNVIVKVQTSFIKGGLKFDDIMAGWKARGARLGVGDYYSVWQSDFSRPANQTGSNLAHIQESIPRFHRQGARFFMTESSDLWGAIGLGHYLAARMIWDVGEADNMDALINDFLSRAFGPASQPMESFFRIIYRFTEKDYRPLIRTDMLARLYRNLAEARQLAADDPEAVARIDDLLLFTHYEELYQRYSAASGEARQVAIERLMRHTWRMRKTMMVHAKPFFTHFANRDSTITNPPPEVYQDETPFSEQEKQDMLTNGIANYEPIEMGFEPVSFSDELVPATPLELPTVADGNYNNTTAPPGSQIFYTWRDAGDPAYFDLIVSGGHIESYQSFSSPVQVSLFANGNTDVGAVVAYDDSVPGDRIVELPVRLNTTFEGLHSIEVFPPSNRAKVWAADHYMPLTMPSGFENYNQLTYWSLYFYVPKGTAIVGGYSTAGTRGSIRDSAGNVLHLFAGTGDSFFAVEVPAGQDGKLWKFHDCRGRKALMTVPPWVACNAESLLLPREVVARDSGSFVQTNEWTGAGLTDLWSDGNNWRSGVPTAGQHVAIIGPTDTVIIDAPCAPLASFRMNGGTLTFTNWTTQLQAERVELKGGTLTLPPPFLDGAMSNRVHIVCTDFILAEGALIDAAAKGYARENGPGKGASGGIRAGGGGHGGHGGMGASYTAYGGKEYGSKRRPVAPGSGGNTQSNHENKGGGGAGGGAVLIEASSSATVDGTINADGENASYRGGGGSGGSIFITCGTFGGGANGLLSARGGTRDHLSGSGGGGRISVQYTALEGNPQVSFLTTPGSEESWDPRTQWFKTAYPGTLFLSDLALLSEDLADGRFQDVRLFTDGGTSWTVNSLTVSNTSLRLADDGFQVTVIGDLNIQAGGALSIGADDGLLTARLTCGGSLVLTNGGALSIYSGVTNGVVDHGAHVSVSNDIQIHAGSWIYPYSHPANGGSVLFRARDVTIDEGGGFFATARGFSWGKGPGKGADGNSRGGGGGYGGAGGQGERVSSLGGKTYGNATLPLDPGSGSGVYYSFGGPGGGLVRIEADNCVLNNGEIVADGGEAHTHSGGGSGGGVFIESASIVGNGLIQANGGSGTAIYSGGGGGGRIAIITQRDRFSGEESGTYTEYGGSENGRISVLGSLVGKEPGTDGTFHIHSLLGTVILIR